jgi:hypothetical protein
MKRRRQHNVDHVWETILCQTTLFFYCLTEPHKPDTFRKTVSLSAQKQPVQKNVRVKQVSVHNRINSINVVIHYMSGTHFINIFKKLNFSFFLVVTRSDMV